MTGLKSTFLRAPRKSPDAMCGAVQADTPLRYMTAFKFTIGERHGKAQMPCVVQIGAPQKAGERLTDDLFSMGRQAIRRRRTLRFAT